MSALRAAVRRWRAEDLEWNRAHGMGAHPRVDFVRTWLEPHRALAILQSMAASLIEDGFVLLQGFEEAELERAGYVLAPGVVDIARLAALAETAAPPPG